MIVDVHSHAFPSERVFTPTFVAEAQRMRSRPLQLVTRYAEYRATARIYFDIER